MKKWVLYLLIFASGRAVCQDTSSRSYAMQSSTDKYKNRQWAVGALTAAGYGGSFIFLSKAWYDDYPRTGFHAFNDAGEWKQMDKAGHAWTAYHTSRLTTNLWRWAGINDKKTVLLGTGSSLLYMLSIEYLDGRSSEWGWSWADVGANVFGATLFAGQEFIFKKQKIGFKFSAHHKDYKDPVLKKRADDLYGSSFQGRLLKDYNAQTYWLSANIKSFFPDTKLPPWLNLSFGYGADGMFGGYQNIKYYEDGSLAFDRRDIRRYRQFYLAPDVDFTKIKTRSKFLKSAFSAINVLKFPAPALEFSNGRFKLKAIAY